MSDYIGQSVSECVYCNLVGASLNEPHIDHDNVPRRGECLYLSSYVQRIALDFVFRSVTHNRRGHGMEHGVPSEVQTAVSIWLRVAFVAPMFPRTHLFT